MSASKKDEGFTLVELLVVIAIIAVLSVIGITIFSSAQRSSRDATRRSDLLAIRNALEQYRTVNNIYPSTNGVFWAEGKCTTPAGGWVVQSDYSGGSAYIPNLAPNYMVILPGDPNVNGVSNRCYIYRSDGTNYIIAAHMGAENTYSGNDMMIRYIAPACTDPQPTFTLQNAGGKCW